MERGKRTANGCLVIVEGMYYSRLSVRGKSVQAHRLAWELFRGPIPDGMCVLHKCDNPPCFDPDHLFLGTKKDNAVDCAQKGRGPFQTTAKPRPALTPEQVQQLRLDRNAGMGYAAICQKFNISRQTAQDAIHGKGTYGRS